MSDPFAGCGRLLMAGCGNMGGAMLRRWLEVGLDPAQVTILSPSGRPGPAGVRVIGEAEASGEIDTLLLGMKPQQLRVAHAAGLGAIRPQIVVSILAGVEVATLAPLWEGVPVIRAMPNLPVALGKGVVALHGDVPVAVREAVGSLMEPLGLAEWVEDEGLFDLVTALAGSGPAFLYRFVDALGAAGESLGLPRDQAARFALATVEGAAALAASSGEPPAVLADRVASPGGSTRAGLDVLDEDWALAALLARTLAAATRRNGELAGLAKG